MVKRHYINIACTTVQEIFPLKKKKKKTIQGIQEPTTQ